MPMAQSISSGIGGQVMNRTTLTHVVFARPFSLTGLDGLQPAGTYIIETEEELLEGLSFPAYRRTGTVMLLPAKPGSMITGQTVAVDPAELDAIAQASKTDPEQARDCDDKSGSPVGRINAPT
ncbi:MAG: hypothetical protein ACREFN_19085 [Acetobacteraceae bacterium]